MASSVRQEQILDRTVDLVAKGGLASLTMKRIAEQVGFSEAAIYRHFPTKQRLLLGVMDRLERLLLDPIRAIAAAAGRSPVPHPHAPPPHRPRPRQSAHPAAR
jgi:AcrR family transcriptional regulator